MNTVEQVRWSVTDAANGVPFRWGYVGEDVVAEWVGILCLRATRTGELKALRAAPGISEDVVEKIRLGVATAFLRAQRHQHALHASAVSWRDEALLCVGASGSGKSTIAECLCRRAGTRLLADDTAIFERSADVALCVVPSESALWLTDGSTGPKAPLKSVPLAQRPAVLRYVVSLVFDDAALRPELRDVRGGDAVEALLPSLVRFETTRALWVRELDFLTALDRGSRILQVRRSHDVSPEAVAEVLFDSLLGGSQ